MPRPLAFLLPLLAGLSALGAWLLSKPLFAGRARISLFCLAGLI